MKNPLVTRWRRRFDPHVAARSKRESRASLFQLFILMIALGFAALTFLARRKPYFDADLRIGRAVQRLEGRWWHELMHAVSLPGYPPQANVLAAVLPLALYRIGLKWEAVMGVLTSLGIGVVGLLVKMFVNRPRPHPDLVRVKRLLDGGTLSFPAGHVQTYVAIIGFAAFISYTIMQKSWQRTVALLTSSIFIALIGPSRIHAGEHWASDVVGGYLLGSLWLWFSVRVYRWGKPRFFVDQSLAGSRRG